MKIKSRKEIFGFTLIELLVVISIIGFLTTVAVVSLNNARIKARNAKRIADVKEIRTALEMYYNDNGAYPVSTGGVQWDGLYTCWGTSSTNWIAGLVPTYMSALPRDPRNHTTCSEQYIYRSDGVGYKILAHSPEDCASIKAQYPSLVDPMRDCWAIGYWNPAGAGY